MAQSRRFEVDQTTVAASATNTTSFSQLLFGDNDDDDDVLSLDLGQSFNYPSCSASVAFPAHHHDRLPRMLCFGGDQTDSDDLLFGNTAVVTQRSGVTCKIDSFPSVSSGSHNNGPLNSLPKSNRKRNGSLESATIAAVKATPAASQGTSKKSKPESPAPRGHAKVRKEKLGERIAALQQLVSPFGKTDTASVLHEAMGYIRFLQDQVQVLCSPYLQPPPFHEGGENGGEEETKDLRSRGLCLVPVACTLHVASSNGADFWSPAMAHGEQCNRVLNI